MWINFLKTLSDNVSQKVNKVPEKIRYIFLGLFNDKEILDIVKQIDITIEDIKNLWKSYKKMESLISILDKLNDIKDNKWLFSYYDKKIEKIKGPVLADFNNDLNNYVIELKEDKISYWEISKYLWSTALKMCYLLNENERQKYYNICIIWKIYELSILIEKTNNLNVDENKGKILFYIEFLKNKWFKWLSDDFDFKFDSRKDEKPKLCRSVPDIQLNF